MSIEFMKKELKLGERLRELREERGLTQKALAGMLNMNSVTYLHYEKKQREPSLETLMTLASFFEVSVDYLIGFSDD